jgi:putative inorganic carbon (hco3(-)) transporter
LAYYLTVLFCFVVIFQPGVILPGLAPLRLVLSVALLTTIAWVLSPRPAPIHRTRHKLNFFIIAFVLAQVISVIQFFWLPGLIEVVVNWGLIALLFFLIGSQARSIDKLTGLWIAASLGVAFIVGQATWVYHTQPLTHMQLSGGRLSGYGAYSGANDLALLMICSWPIVFKFMDLSRNRLLRFLPVPLLLLMAYVTLRTLSRAGLIALGIVVGLSLIKGRSLGRLGRWTLLIPAVLIVFMVGSKLLLTRKDAQDFSGKDESVQHRFDAWYAGYAMLKSSPVYGVGSGAFVENSRDFGAGRKIQAHNTIVKVAAETGLIGLVSYLGMIFFAFRSLWINWRRFGKLKPHGSEVLWAEALGISLIGFFFSTQFSVKAHEWLLYLILGSVVALDRLYLRETLIQYLKVEEIRKRLNSSGTNSA